MNIDILKSFAGGEFIDNNISFIGKDKSGILGKELKFPLSEKDCVEHLLPISSEAYFGKNDQAVLDPEYRRAQVIYPDSFFTNFDPNNYDIIDTIQLQMGDAASNIKFVKDKLNIYSKDGHFKKHKDTPRSPDMIGTLVVCFPSAFTGGDLILNTESPTVFQFDKLSSTHFQWAAFYGDIDHEVKTVESGYRITLTYLIIKSNNITKPNIQTINHIKQILDNPDILPDGGFLGYGCKYLYSINSNLTAYKGEDYSIYNTFKNLGFNIIVEHISFLQELDDWNGYQCDCCKRKNSSDLQLVFVNQKYKDYDSLDVCLDCSRTKKGVEYIRKYNIGGVFYTAPEKKEYVNARNIYNMVEMCGKKLVGNIYWLNNPYNGESKKAIEADILYGNDPTTHEEIYKRCALLMYINNYEERKNGKYQPEEIPSYLYSNVFNFEDNNVSESEDNNVSESEDNNVSESEDNNVSESEDNNVSESEH